ncbi:uncharacterized protein LOC111335424 [Stylophora pistillata]|uniref:uncharacterized protein LOC111335424 n=1 Tax=Stylophora pistillata TaxID=50429 RepID=UPI000C04FCF0|nr:uncharacterized protein LOC111335424 [Stylophora pistillata]
MEYRVSAPSRFTGCTPAVAGSRRTSHIFIAPTKGTFTTNGIYAVEEPIKKAPKRPKPKDYDIIYKAYLEIREENATLRREGQQLRDELLQTKSKLLAVSQENEELKAQISQLPFPENWGQVIRGKDEELKRLKESIRKMSFDRAEAINNKSMVELSVDELKLKLRNKDKEVRDAKELEKIQSKAKILNETEKLRNERNTAVANLTRLEAVVDKLRQDASHNKRISEERKMVIQEIHMRLTSKEKHVDDLRKQLALSRLFSK